MSPPVIFARAARRLRRDRAQPCFAEYAFLRAVMLDGIADRLAVVTRSFGDVLDLGCFDASFAPPPGARVARLDPGFAFASAAAGVQGDEDRLPFADASFDLVVSAGVLDQVDDLPGALALIRRVLRPDGLFLGAFVGGASLPRLRQAWRSAERDRPAARFHPAVDLRAAGDLLMRAGFALPVADLETVEVGYPNMLRLTADLRGMAASNLLAERQSSSRSGLVVAADAFQAQAGPDGRVRESFQIIHLTGWAPDPSQPKPARRGSGVASLATALRPPVKN